MPEDHVVKLLQNDTIARFLLFCTWVRTTRLILLPAFLFALSGLEPGFAADSPVGLQNGAATGFVQLQALQGKGAKISALVVDLETGNAVAALDQTALLTPASITKIVLAAAVLEQFGAEHTFKTKVYIEGGRRRGTKVDGDLVISGAGDPGLTNEFLWRLATNIQRLGIREVTGKLVLETGYFAPFELDANRLAGKSGSTNAYDSPLSAASVNFSVMGVFVAPGEQVGRRAVVALEPYSLESVRLVNKVTTGKSGSPTRLEVSRSSVSKQDVYTAMGSIAADAKPQTIYRSVSDPDRYALEVFAAFLEQSGVKINEKTVRRSKTRPVAEQNGAILVELESQPIEWNLRGLLRYSNNFIADMLTIQLGAGVQTQNWGLSLQDGNQALERYVAAKLASQKKNDGAVTRPVIDSGSGLTPENKLSAEQVMAVLQAVYQGSSERDGIFADLFASLPAAGKEGTLTNRFKSPKNAWLRGRLRAKTGTLTEPVEAVSLAGFSRSRSGKWVAFVVIENGTAQKAGFGVDTVRAAIETDLSSILGNY